MTLSAPPQVLIADDDSVSLLFLASALRELGCEASAVASGSAVLRACEEQVFDLLLLDRCMPDLGGAALLAALRARGIDADAIATSAELDAAMRGELRAAGYVAALTKPIGIDQLACLLADRLPDWHARQHARPKGRTMPTAADCLDDSAALTSTGGDANALRALRRLLLQDLEATTPLIAATPTPMSMRDLRDYLHRLQAACRYCGTPALAAAALRLATKLQAIDPYVQAELDEFMDASRRTCAALANQLAADAP